MELFLVVAIIYFYLTNIKGGKLFKGGNYLRKYGTLQFSWKSKTI